MRRGGLIETAVEAQLPGQPEEPARQLSLQCESFSHPGVDEFVKL